MNLKKKLGRKGQALQVWLISGIVIIMGLLTWAISAIVMQAFRDSQLTGAAGCNATTKAGCGFAYNISQGGLTFLSNASSQLGTAGTILGVSLLLVIMGAIGFGAYMGYQKFR